MFLTCGITSAQSNHDDLNLLLSHDNAKASVNKRNLSYYNPIAFITRQIYLSDNYANSFSGFSKETVKDFGLIKGLVLSIDRITRSGRLSYMAVPTIRYDLQRKIIDLPEYYRSRNEE
jgi:putative component of membrane protein insertase Oxa1/YidC/SpoIIIJ protein YidD